MGANTSIAWTDHSWNPWWGCVKVSPGCTNCYAATFAKRVGEDVWGPNAPRRFFGDKHWAEPLKWNRDAGQAGVRKRVFCASMADVFEDRHDLVEPRERLVQLIHDTPNLDWQILTKRPENVNRLSPWFDGRNGPEWPRNIWLGTTCEDQQRADERIPHLLAVPAVVRFLSVEPMLGPMDLDFLRGCRGCNHPGNLLTTWNEHGRCSECDGTRHEPSGIHWVIVGGESGGGARPFDVAWARSIVAQCREAGVACFVKQLGAHPIEGGTSPRRRGPSAAFASTTLRAATPPSGPRTCA